MRFPRLFLALVARLVASFGVERPGATRPAAMAALTWGESPHPGDGWLQKGVSSPRVATPRLPARLPAVAAGAGSRLLVFVVLIALVVLYGVFSS